MAEYIDRQAAIDVLATMQGLCTSKTALIQNSKIWQQIKDLPSADAVEVVRCKDCEHSTQWYRDRRRCFLWNENGISVFEDGFCNYGERKDDEQND